MKKTVQLMTVLLVILIVLGTFGCGKQELTPSLASPEGTVREYYRAMEAKDKYRMANLLADEEEKRMFLKFTDSSKMATVNISVISLETDIIAERDNEAFVKVSAEVVERNTSSGITTQHHEGGIWHLINQNGRWLILTFQSSESEIKGSP